MDAQREWRETNRGGEKHASLSHATSPSGQRAAGSGAGLAWRPWTPVLHVLGVDPRAGEGCMACFRGPRFGAGV